MQSRDIQPRLTVAPTPEAAMEYEELSPAQFEAQLPTIMEVDSDAVMLRGVLYAKKLREKGLDSLRTNLIQGEDEALETYLMNYLKGTMGNMALVSPYGAGKTELINHGYKVIGGIEGQNVAHVEATPDLRAEQLVGSFQSMTKTTEVDGIKTVETLTGSGNAILHEGVQLAIFDEANRGNPRTLATTGNIVGSRMLEIGGRTMYFDDLEATMFAFNPGESLATSFVMPGNLAARATSGTIMADESNWDRILDGMTEFTPSPEDIKPVITLPQLHIAQAAVSMVGMSEVGDYLKSSTKNVLVALRDNGELSINEAPGRVLRQLQVNAQVRALSHGRVVASHEDVNHAVAAKVTGSMAMNGADSIGFIQTTVDEVLNRTA